MFISKDQLAAIAREANPIESAALALSRATGMPFEQAQQHPAAQELNWMMKQENQPRQADEMSEFDAKLAADHELQHRSMSDANHVA